MLCKNTLCICFVNYDWLIEFTVSKNIPSIYFSHSSNIFSTCYSIFSNYLLDPDYYESSKSDYAYYLLFDSHFIYVLNLVYFSLGILYFSVMTVFEMGSLPFCSYFLYIIERTYLNYGFGMKPVFKFASLNTPSVILFFGMNLKHFDVNDESIIRRYFYEW